MLSVLAGMYEKQEKAREEKMLAEAKKPPEFNIDCSKAVINLGGGRKIEINENKITVSGDPDHCDLETRFGYGKVSVLFSDKKS